MSHSGEGSVWYQREIAISAKKRGCHLITDDVLHQVPEIQKIKIGVANIHSKLRCITVKTILSAGPKLLRHRQKKCSLLYKYQIIFSNLLKLQVPVQLLSVVFFS